MAFKAHGKFFLNIGNKCNLPAQPFYLLSFSALFSGRVVSSNILAMLPMTSSQVHLWSIGLWMLIGVLIISPTAGGGGLGRLRCNVDSEGGKYTSASPRCTCLPPRQHCAEVALGAFTTDSSAMLTRREASTPRLRLGVLASLLVNIALKLHSEESKYTSATPRCTCFPPRATSTQVPLVQVQVPKSNSASPRWTWGLGLGLGGLELKLHEEESKYTEA